MPRVAREVGRDAACTSAATTRRTAAAATSGSATALGDVPLVATGSPYAVTPGVAAQGRRHAVPRLLAVRPGLAGARRALARRRTPRTRAVDRRRAARPTASRPTPTSAASCCRRPGERGGARSAGRSFRDERRRRRTPRRATGRRVDGTSRLSVYLKYGCVHPRTLLAELGRRRRRAQARAASWSCATSTPTCCGTGRSRRARSCSRSWRRWSTTRGRRPTRGSRRGRPADRLPDRRRRDAPAARRGVGAQPGADGRRRRSSPRTCTCTGGAARGTSCSTCATATSPATSRAGSGSPAPGTDPSPYFRVFNPVKQGRDHDPDGDYVRRWVPELRDVPGQARARAVEAAGRAAERLPAAGRRPRRRAAEALRRYAAVKG